MPGITELGTFEYDNLHAGKAGPTAHGLLAMGQNLKRGTLVRDTGSVLTTPAPSNTGNGTIDNLQTKPGAKIGTWKFLCVSGGGPGDFRLIEPDGNVSDEIGVGVAYDGPAFSFTLNNGSSQFVKGDSIDVVVSSGKWAQIEPDGANSLNMPVGVLAGDVDATPGDMPCVVYRGGHFQKPGIIVPAATTIDQFEYVLFRNGFVLFDPVPA